MQDFKTLHFKLFNFFYLILQATSAEIIPLDSKGSSIKSHAVVAGGGAIEMELSRFLREYLRDIPGKT